MPACVQVLLDNPLWEQYAVTATSAERMFQAALSSGAEILTAKRGGQLAGFVWYVTRGAWDRSGYIRLIGVSPRFQGQKCGESLMGAAEELLAQQVPDVFLLVTDSNLAAQRFYLRVGYRQVGAIPDYVKPGLTELIFHKKFSS